MNFKTQASFRTLADAVASGGCHSWVKLLWVME